MAQNGRFLVSHSRAIITIVIYKLKVSGGNFTHDPVGPISSLVLNRISGKNNRLNQTPPNTLSEICQTIIGFMY